MRRRELLKTTALSALMAGKLAAQAPRASAKDRLGIGMIGVGGMGTSNLRDFLTNPDVNVVAICDVYQPNLERALGLAAGKAKSYLDYRRLLEDRNVDAVVISTPEHWHAIMCIDACNAGKDVYVEKPASHCVKSRQRPIADIESGHYANTVCRLGNIAYRVGRKLRWDNAKERVTGDPEANQLVVGTYREPWKPKGL